jgi:hypothetical protein
MGIHKLHFQIAEFLLYLPIVVLTVTHLFVANIPIIVKYLCEIKITKKVVKNTKLGKRCGIFPAHPPIFICDFIFAELATYRVISKVVQIF